MNRFFLILISLVHASAVYSQTRVGKVEIGASSDLSMLYAVDKSNSNSNDFFEGQLTPQVGYFINDRTSIGCNLAFSYVHIKYREQNILTFGIGPYINYYFNGSPIKPYIFGETAYLLEYINSSWSGSDTRTGIGGALGVGSEYMIKENIGLNGGLGFSYTNFFKNDEHIISIAIKFGFKFYL